MTSLCLSCFPDVWEILRYQGRNKSGRRICLWPINFFEYVFKKNAQPHQNEKDMQELSGCRSSNRQCGEVASSQIITYRHTAFTPDFASIRLSQTHSEDFFQALPHRTPKLPEIYGVKLGQKIVCKFAMRWKGFLITASFFFLSLMWSEALWLAGLEMNDWYIL